GLATGCRPLAVGFPSSGQQPIAKSQQPFSPARLADAGDLAVQRHLAKNDTRDAELTQESTATARDGAAVVEADRAGVPGQLLQPFPGPFRLHPAAPLGILCHHAPTLGLAGHPAFLRHCVLLLRLCLATMRTLQAQAATGSACSRRTNGIPSA